MCRDFIVLYQDCFSGGLKMSTFNDGFHNKQQVFYKRTIGIIGTIGVYFKKVLR